MDARLLARLLCLVLLSCGADRASKPAIEAEPGSGSGGQSSQGGTFAEGGSAANEPDGSGGKAGASSAGKSGGGGKPSGAGGHVSGAGGTGQTAGQSTGGFPAVGGNGSGPVAFPLVLSPSKRYLVDQNGAPFLINQASSWGLIQALSTSDAKDYLDSLVQRGFNTVMVSIISYDVRMAGNPPKWQGISPFKTEWDYSTYNEAYFAHADEILNMAKDRGLLVTLVPSYLGYPGEPTQGWADEMLSANNSVAKSQLYGEFLGARYKDFSNIIWIAGGDNTPAAGSELESRLKAIIDGIKKNDPGHLWTAHWDSVAHGTGIMSTENPTFASYMDIEGYYAYNYDPTQDRDLEFYGHTPAKMLYHLDQSYETEGGGAPENIRRKAYGAMLSGAAGSSFCAGPTWYLFSTWRSNMDTVGTRETWFWYKAFRSRNWYDLVPDSAHAVVTSGLGIPSSTDFVTAARTASKGTVMAYLPSSRAVTVDLSSLSGTQARVWWYDPTTGNATDGGKLPTTGSQQLTPPGQGSWLLVIDDASLGLPAPGATPVQRVAPPPISAPLPGGTAVLLAACLFALGVVALRLGAPRGPSGLRFARRPLA